METKIWFSYTRNTELFERYLNILYKTNNRMIGKIGWFKATFSANEKKDRNGNKQIKVIDVVDLNYNGKEKIREKIKDYEGVCLVENSEYYILEGDKEKIHKISEEVLCQIKKKYTRKYLRWLKPLGTLVIGLIACYLWLFHNANVEPTITIYIDKIILIIQGIIAVVLLGGLTLGYIRVKKNISEKELIEDFENMMKSKMRLQIVLYVVVFLFIMNVALTM